MTSKNKANDKAIRSIVKQWSGGERKLAGARASELVFGSSRKPNDKLLDKIAEEIPGIREYIVAPSEPPVVQVPDHGGNPNVEDQQNTLSATKSNTSSDAAKDEQKVIDDQLAAGRAQRDDAGEIGSTKLNPAGSDQDPKGEAAKPNNVKAAK